MLPSSLIASGNVILTIRSWQTALALLERMEAPEVET